MKSIKLEYVSAAIITIVVLFFASEIVRSPTRQPRLQPHQRQPEYQFPPYKQPQPTPTYEDAVKSITTSECRSHVYKLSGWSGRVPGTTGNEQATEWIRGLFKKYGCKTELQDIRRKGAKNIIGWIEGTTLKDEIVVIGGHMDHISRSPGADDNASGTAAVIEIAQAFSMLPPPKRTVVFMAFNCEEQGLVGSRYYCNNPTFPRGRPSIKNHVFMLNFDMIGYLKTARKIQTSYAERSPDIRGHIRNLNSKYPFTGKIVKYGGGGSDQQSFLNKGVAVAWCFTGLHSAYHKPTDTPERIEKQGSYKGVRDITRFGFELAYKVANDSARPVFMWDGKEIPPTHDHNDPRTPFPNTRGVGNAYRSNR